MTGNLQPIFLTAAGIAGGVAYIMFDRLLPPMPFWADALLFLFFVALAVLFAHLAAKAPKVEELEMWPSIFLGAIAIGVILTLVGIIGYVVSAQTQVVDSESKAVGVPLKESTQPVIASELQAAYEELSDKLGRPTKEARSAGQASIQFYEKGDVLWISNLARLYRLKKQGKTWDDALHTLEVNYPIDEKYRNEEYIRSQLPDFPKDKKVPWGGVAKEWIASPKDWQWLGGRDWLCEMDENSVLIQEFEHGKLFGPYPRGETSDDSQVMALFDDGTWEPMRAPQNVEPKRCGDESAMTGDDRRITTTNQSGGVNISGDVHMQPQPRSLDNNVRGQLLSKIPAGNKVIVETVTTNEAFAFAKQIEEFLLSQGFAEVEFRSLMMTASPVTGQSIGDYILDKA